MPQHTPTTAGRGKSIAPNPGHITASAEPGALQIAGWKHILNTLSVHYGDRIAAAGY